MQHTVPEILGLFCVCQSGFVDLEKLLTLPQIVVVLIMTETLSSLTYSERRVVVKGMLLLVFQLYLFLAVHNLWFSLKLSSKL